MRYVEKAVNKLVEKMVQKMWMLNVKKYKKWNNPNSSTNFFTQSTPFTRVFQNIFDRFYTNISPITPLLNMSFTSFTHRTTITTTNLLIMEKE